MIVITPNIAIQDSEISETFIRASGPGGQNVNKVSSAVQLRFDAAASPALCEEMRRRLRRLAGRRMTQDDVLVIEARRFRTRERNRQDAVERLTALLRAAAQAPKTRQKTRTPARSRKRRLESKRRRAETKRLRGSTED